MKTTQALMGFVLVATLSSSAMAGGFSKNKRKFNRANKINTKTFESKIKGKTFRCEGYFSDNGKGYESYQFITVNGKILNNLDKDSYEITNTLVGTEQRSFGPSPVYFRLTSSGELVAFQDSGYTEQYIYCPSSKVLTGKKATLETIMSSEIDAVAVNDLGIKVVLTTKLETLANGEQEHKDYINVLNAENKVLLTQSAEAFIGKLGLNEDFYGFPPRAQLIVYNNEFYLNGSFYKKESSGSLEMTIKFDSTLTNPTIVTSGQDGELKINPENGELSYYGIDQKLRSGTLVTIYTNEGEKISQKHFDQMRETTGFEGAVLTTGDVVLSSYCDYRYDEMYGCPERNINYAGVSIATAEGKLKKFFTGTGAMDMSKPVTIQALSGGNFIVGFKVYNDVITLVKYDSEGNILNVYGMGSDTPETSSLVIMPDYEKENLSITKEGKVTWSQGNRIYSFQM